MANKTIIIAGAGISGLSAAITLAKAGYDVMVYEKNKTIGERFHGDFQGLESWTTEEDVLDSLKRMNININFPVHPAKKFRVYDSNLEYEEAKSKTPLYYLVRRGHFKDTIDYGLYKQAKESGVKVYFNKQINEENADIIATGPKYSDMIAKGISFKTNIPDCTYVLVDEKAAPTGYSYMIVNKKRAVIISCVLLHFKDIETFLDETIKKFKRIRKFEMKDKKEVVGYGAFFLQNSAKKKGKLYVGEAAGFQDYLFGFGMRYAATSGYLAAKSIIENKNYNKLWKKEFGEKLKVAVVNRYIFEHFTKSEVRIAEMFSKVLDSKAIFEQLYKPTLLKKLLYPVIKQILKSRRKCKRGCSCTWCRERFQQLN